MSPIRIQVTTSPRHSIAFEMRPAAIPAMVYGAMLDYVLERADLTLVCNPTMAPLNAVRAVMKEYPALKLLIGHQRMLADLLAAAPGSSIAHGLAN